MRFLLIILSVIILGLTGTQTVNASPPSAFDMEKPADNWGLELSPDGNRVAFIRTKASRVCLDRYGQVRKKDMTDCKDAKKEYSNQYRIDVYDLVAGKFIRQIDLPAQNYVSWLEWAGNSRLLAAVSSRTTAGKRGIMVGGSRIISIALDGGENATLFGDEKKVDRQNLRLSRITDLLHHDPDHVIMPAWRNSDLDLFKVNVVTGSAERIAKGSSNTFYWYTDRKGEPVMRYDCSGKCRKVKVYKYVTESDNSGGERVTSEDNKTWKKIKTFDLKPNEDEEDFDFYPVAQTDNEDQYYVISQEDDAPRRSIKIFDLEKEEYVRTVFEHPKMDVGGVVRSVGAGDYMGVYYYEDRLTYELTDKRLQKHLNGLNKYFKNTSNINLLGFNKAGTLAVVHASSPDNPGSYHIYDFNKKTIDQLLPQRNALDGKLKSKTDILQVPTRDGQSITAYLTYPKGARQTAPLIVMPHGGPEQRDYFDYASGVQYLVTRGYQVLQPNFRGSSGYGRAFAEAGYGEWDGTMHEDLTDSVKYVFEQGRATQEKTCIFGYSYGGYAALLAAAKTPELYQCVIAGGGISDLRAFLKAKKKEHGSDSEIYEYWIESIGNPKTEETKIAAASPINMAGQIQVPVMLLHGEWDGIVEVEQSQKMQKALKKAGKAVEYWEIEEEGHYGWDLDIEIDYLEKTEAVKDCASRVKPCQLPHSNLPVLARPVKPPRNQ